MRSAPRRAQRRDSNERPIVDAMRDAGMLVEQGGYVCDLMVYASSIDRLCPCCRKWHPIDDGRVNLLEVKRPKGARLTDTQIRLKDEGWPIRVVRSVEEAFEAVDTAGG